MVYFAFKFNHGTIIELPRDFWILNSFQVDIK